MGTVIEFRRPEREPANRRPEHYRVDAEIVIFPGVRVEYHSVDLSHRVMSVAQHDVEPTWR